MCVDANITAWSYRTLHHDAISEEESSPVLIFQDQNKAQTPVFGVYHTLCVFNVQSCL